MYADDLLLISSTRSDLRRMLRTADPLRASLGPGELRSLTGLPAGYLTPEGSRGPSDTAGPG